MSALQGNRILRLLQERRIAGTLDLDLPSEATKGTTQDLIDRGLEWLREHYPMDEDAAIVARIDREQKVEEQRLISRAQHLGIYKPQSGEFDSERSKEGDVYGKSVLREIRQKNEEKNKVDSEKEREEWLNGEAKRQETLQKQLQQNPDLQLQPADEAALTQGGQLEYLMGFGTSKTYVNTHRLAKPRADPNLRPALAWIQQHHVRATSNDDPSRLTTVFMPPILPYIYIYIYISIIC